MSTIVASVEGPLSFSASFNVNITVSGSDTAVFVAVKATQAITAITCDGVAMSLVGNTTGAFGGDALLYVRTGVPTGTRVCAVTFANPTVPTLLIQSRSGVNQSTPTRTPTIVTLSGSFSFSQACASVSGEDVLTFLSLVRAASVLTPTAPTAATITQSYMDTADCRGILLNTVASGTSTTVAGTVAGGDGAETFIGVGIQDVGGAAPSAPSGLNVTASAPGTVDLAWTDNSTTETGFKIFRSLNGGAYSQIGATTAANATSAAGVPTVANAVNRFKVVATNGSGDSGDSNIIVLDYTGGGGGGATGGGALIDGGLVH